MDPFSLISTGMAVVGGVAKIVDGFANKKAAELKLRQAEAMPMPINPFEAMQVASEDIEMRREDIQRESAQAAQAMREAGTRAIAGGIGSVNEAAIQGSRQIGADLEQRLAKKSELIAGRQTEIDDYYLAERAAKISGAAQDIGAARQDIASGFGDMAQIGMSLGLGRMEQKATQTGSNQPDPKKLGETHVGQAVKGIGKGIGSIFKKKNK